MSTPDFLKMLVLISKVLFSLANENKLRWPCRLLVLDNTQKVLSDFDLEWHANAAIDGPEVLCDQTPSYTVDFIAHFPYTATLTDSDGRAVWLLADREGVHIPVAEHDKATEN